MLVSEFDFQLPEELIAQAPPKERTQARMLVLRRKDGYSEIKRFCEFLFHMQPDDCIVVNDTKVIPARLYGNKIVGGAKVEALLMEEVQKGVWKAMLRPARRIKIGSEIYFESSKKERFRVKKQYDDRVFEIEFSTLDVLKLLNTYGHMPLPPYIRRKATVNDSSRYQTVYSTNEGAIAAPTAGLHFDNDIIRTLKDRKVNLVPITLHINLGTFKPVTKKCVKDHSMHSERYIISEESANLINRTKCGKGKILAVGTSVVRALESCSDINGKVQPGSGSTDLFLHPPMKPKVVDRLLTNFHLPKSTLLMLVSTFASREAILRAYNLAILERFRFYSYGDCMLLI